jgi:hypothetical protein
MQQCVCDSSVVTLGLGLGLEGGPFLIHHTDFDQTSWGDTRENLMTSHLKTFLKMGQGQGQGGGQRVIVTRTFFIKNGTHFLGLNRLWEA